MNPVNINFERPQFSKEDSARNMEVVNRWISDSAEKLNMLVSILQNEETHADATGDSIGEATMNFTSSDVADGSAAEWTSVPALSSGEKHNAILGKVSQMFKNVRYLFKILGTTDISGIGDGTATGAISSLNADLAKQHPIGSVYISFDSTDPGTLYGGTWERLKKVFLFAADDDQYTVGSSGGEETHTLTVDEMPSHSHTTTFYNDDFSNGGDTETNLDRKKQSPGLTYDVSWKNGAWQYSSNVTGGNAAHNNMPPYITAYMWRRVA